MVCQWLTTGMLSDEDDPQTLAKEIIKELGDHALTKSHERHLSYDKCNSIGLKVEALENDSTLQDKVLSVHHACILTLDQTPAFKMIENHMGIAYIRRVPMLIAQQIK